MPEILYNQESRVHWGLIIRLRTPMHIGLYTKVYWTDTHTHSHARARSCMDGHAFANVSKNTANNNNHFCIIILSEPAIYIFYRRCARSCRQGSFYWAWICLACWDSHFVDLYASFDGCIQRRSGPSQTGGSLDKAAVQTKVRLLSVLWRGTAVAISRSLIIDRQNKYAWDNTSKDRLENNEDELQGTMGHRWTTGFTLQIDDKEACLEEQW